jgi:hypothetical protein
MKDPNAAAKAAKNRERKAIKAAADRLRRWNTTSDPLTKIYKTESITAAVEYRDADRALIVDAYLELTKGTI